MWIVQMKTELYDNDHFWGPFGHYDEAEYWIINHQYKVAELLKCQLHEIKFSVEAIERPDII